ncbi:hypothetical protein H6503_02450 [Candidatus Woesearchaeota archaeon]|nr:hypothetical protein [Candidatus Woesearchaeota archaeon]
MKKKVTKKSVEKKSTSSDVSKKAKASKSKSKPKSSRPIKVTVKTGTVVKPIAKIGKKSSAGLDNGLKVHDKIITADVAFYCCNGSVFYCLGDLVAGLIIMDENAFRFHVNKDKNDFYNWIMHIFKEEELAEKIKKITSSSALKKVIQKAIIP